MQLNDAMKSALVGYGYEGGLMESLRNFFWDQAHGTPYSYGWTIGNSGTTYGFFEGSFGAMVPPTINGQGVDKFYIGNTGLFILGMDNALKIPGVDFLDVEIEGWESPLTLTWNGVRYQRTGSTDFYDYLVSQLGNTLGVNFLYITPWAYTWIPALSGTTYGYTRSIYGEIIPDDSGPYPIYTLRVYSSNLLMLQFVDDVKIPGVDSVEVEIEGWAGSPVTLSWYAAGHSYQATGQTGLSAFIAGLADTAIGVSINYTLPDPPWEMAMVVGGTSPWGYRRSQYGALYPNAIGGEEVEYFYTYSNDSVLLRVLGGLQLSGKEVIRIAMEGFSGSPLLLSWADGTQIYSGTNPPIGTYLPSVVDDTVGITISTDWDFYMTVGNDGSRYGFYNGSYGDLEPGSIAGENIYWINARVGDFVHFRLYSAGKLEEQDTILVIFEGFSDDPVTFNWAGSWYATEETLGIYDYFIGKDADVIGMNVSYPVATQLPTYPGPHENTPYPAIGDAERAFLFSQVAAPAGMDDMWMQYLRSKGYTGHINDMKLAWWSDGAPI